MLEKEKRENTSESRSVDECTRRWMREEPIWMKTATKDKNATRYSGERAPSKKRLTEQDTEMNILKYSHSRRKKLCRQSNFSPVLNQRGPPTISKI